MLPPALGQLMYVRTDLNYACERAICKDPMTRRIETQEFIDNMPRAIFELCTAYSYVGLLFSRSMVTVTNWILRLLSMTDHRVLSRPCRVHTCSDSSASASIQFDSVPDLFLYVPTPETLRFTPISESIYLVTICHHTWNRAHWFLLEFSLESEYNMLYCMLCNIKLIRQTTVFIFHVEAGWSKAYPTCVEWSEAGAGPRPRWVWLVASRAGLSDVC